ncbi:glycosyltransferase family 2 protein, partial [Hydrogenimonas sp.]
MIKRSEKEIIKNWKRQSGKPLVSCCCISYNHEKYIESALDSILMQKTDFPFEIIVRDDCSTDQTQNIIKKYAKKFPSIIKPILE